MLCRIFLFPLPVLPVCHKFVHSMQVCVPNFKTQVKVKFCLSPLNSMWQGSQSHQPTVSCDPDQPPCAGSEVDVGFKKSATTN